MNTIENVFKDTRYNMACTYIVSCLGETEIFTRATKNDMLRIWGKEEASVRFINTRELMIAVK